MRFWEEAKQACRKIILPQRVPLLKSSSKPERYLSVWSRRGAVPLTLEPLAAVGRLSPLGSEGFVEGSFGLVDPHLA